MLRSWPRQLAHRLVRGYLRRLLAAETVEKILGLPLLGDARQPQVRAFGSDVFTG